MSAQLLHLSHHYHDPLGGHHMDTAPTLTKAERRLERDLSDARKHRRPWQFRAVLVDNAAVLLRALEIWS